jgi:hypothetical protein
MAHHYGHPVKVRRRADGTPASFRWRDARYPVAEVFSSWHLMDRSWEQPTNPATAIYSLRHGEQVFDLHHDAVTNLWVLDVAHD